MSAMNIRKGDLVVVIAGSAVDKGKKAIVTATSPKNGTVVVEGVNMQKHHKKPKDAKAAGGITTVAGPIDVSNVMLYCTKCGKAERVAHTLDEKGRSVRVCCKCKTVFDKAPDKAAKVAAKAIKAAKKAEPKTDKPKKAKKVVETDKVEKTDKAE